MPRKAGRRKPISAEVVVLKTVRFKFWITVNAGISGSGCHSCRRELLTKIGCISLNAAFCRLVFLQLTSNQIDMAEACGSRTQTLDSQLTANDDVAASAKFQLESTGVRTFHFHAKLSLILRGSLPCSLCRGPRTLCTCLLGTNQAVLSGEWFRSMKAHSSVVPQKFKK
jgi:hypothetical protein